jgi:Tol biopolymer transport system component
VTSIPGGEDEPGSYSPNGTWLEFARFVDDSPAGLFVVKLNGRGLRRITPSGALIDGDRFGDWSPRGDTIIFAQHATADVRNSIWVVHADGRGLRRIHFDSPVLCGGALADPLSFGCFDPTWSPDGKKMAFIVNQPGGEGESVYTANADGTHMRRLTHEESEYADWGTHGAMR